MATKHYCDCCALEIDHNSMGQRLEIPCHIAEERHGYIDRQMNQVSGRMVDFDLCARCTNLVYGVAFAEIKKLQTERNFSTVVGRGRKPVDLWTCSACTVREGVSEVYTISREECLKCNCQTCFEWLRDNPDPEAGTIWSLGEAKQLWKEIGYYDMGNLATMCKVDRDDLLRWLTDPIQMNAPKEDVDRIVDKLKKILLARTKRK